MNWYQIQGELESIAKRIMKNKIIDAATVAMIDAIPGVGGFLSQYWKSLGGDEGIAQQMATLIEAIAEQEKAFTNLSDLVKDQGEKLLEQHASLGEILVSVDETRDSVKEIKLQFTRFIKTLRIPSARAAFEVAAAMGEDYRQSRDRIRHAEMKLRQAGMETDAHSYYLLGILYLSMSDFEDAEACLLKAVEMQPNIADALIGLAIIYQRRATDHLFQENYGLAEDAVMKSEGYVKSAMLYDPTDVSHQLHLGYLYKDLALRYVGTGKVAKAQEVADKAWACFETELKIKPEDASTHNGLGSICLIRSDYDGAIAYCSKAIELMPNYLFAYFDLAQAYYAKAMGTQDKLSRLQAMENGLEAYIKVVELDGKPGQDSLTLHARQAIDQMYQQVIAQINEALT
jgi:tetratricopeptide (TPR) repeat protein